MTQHAEPIATPLRSGYEGLDPTRALLRQVSLFAELDEDALAWLARGSQSIAYAAGARIVNRGDAGRSLLVIESGIAEVVLERPTGEHVRLQELHRTHYFGEMSLFDGQPRSATVVAITTCQVLELDREAVLEKLDAAGSRQLLVDLAARVRRTDVTVTELADKVYRAAYANVHAAVSVELDTIKTLYQRTEHRANHTLEEAKQRVAASMARADGVLADVQRRVDATWSLFKRRLLPAASILGFALAALGIQSYRDLRAKYDEAVGWHGAMGKLHDQMQAANTILRVVGETETALRGAREAAFLQHPAKTSAELRRAAQGFENAKTELMARYLRAADGTNRFQEFEPRVAFEAVDTFVVMAAWARSDGRPVLTPSERRLLLDALLYVLRNIHETEARAQAVALPLPLDNKLRDVFHLLAGKPPVPASLIASLEEIASRPPSKRAGDNAALILAGLEHRSPTLIRALRQNLDDKNPWNSAASALALAKLRDRGAWQFIKQRLEDETQRYPVAALLAQDGLGVIRGLARSFRDGALLTTITQQTRAALESHMPRNCYEQQYKNSLLACVDSVCGPPPATVGDCILEGN